jgi:hypothetical protein
MHFFDIKMHFLAHIKNPKFFSYVFFNSLQNAQFYPKNAHFDPKNALFDPKNAHFDP